MCCVFVVQMCRSRSRSRAGRTEFYLDDPQAPAARSRRCGKSKRKGKKKHERSRVRQPYMNTCLSIPYPSSKFRS